MARPKKARPTSVEIYRGADGAWHGYLTVGLKPDGRPDRRHRSARTEDECAAKIRKLEDDLATESVTGPGVSPKLSQWLRYWLENIARPSVSYKTFYGSYEYCVRLYLIPGLGEHRLDRLEREPEHIDALYRRLLGTPEQPGRLSPGTVALVHRTLRAALNDAVRLKKIRTNPANSAKAPESEADEIQSMTADEQAKFLAALTGRRTGTRWLMAMIGLRQGEALGLRWPDIDFETRIASIQGKAQRRTWRHGCKDPARCARDRCRTTGCPVAWEHGCQDRSTCSAKQGRACLARRQKHCPRHRGACPAPCRAGCVKHAASCPQRTGGGVVIETDEQRGPKKSRRRLKTKTKAGTRRLGLPREILDELLDHRERQAAEREHAGSMWVEHDLVFPTVVGMPVDPKRDWEDWKAILAEAGLRDMRPHDARHTAATMLLAKGVDRRVVMDIMGWASERMLGRYQHVADEMRQEAARRLGEGLFGAPLATDHATGSATNVIDFADRRRNRRSS
jgi:integrase